MAPTASCSYVIAQMQLKFKATLWKWNVSKRVDLKCSVYMQCSDHSTGQTNFIYIKVTCLYNFKTILVQSIKEADNLLLFTSRGPLFHRQTKF